ncbi:hypothetical protein PENTCL1PPCAC_13558, partial [Pristionchus entomophagus]
EFLPDLVPFAQLRLVFASQEDCSGKAFRLSRAMIGEPHATIRKQLGPGRIRMVARLHGVILSIELFPQEICPYWSAHQLALFNIIRWDVCRMQVCLCREFTTATIVSFR